MARGRKIGVLTFHNCINYGSYWQARCLIEGLRRRGHDAELLDHHCRGVEWAEARCAFQPMLPRRVGRQDMPAYSRKARKFVREIGKLPRSRPSPLHGSHAVAGYDTVLVGSDEVWNLAHPWYGGKALFYGVGVEAPRLVSYAASFGNYSCHWGIDPYWAEQLERFDCLSVRDQNSFWLVNGSTGREPELVLDPCLQFPEAALAHAAPEERERFALVYGHNFPAWLASAVRQWADAEKVRLVSVGYRNDFADEQLIDAGPLEFARLMAGAGAVVTNFFHGCVFALLHGKPFVTAPSDYRLNKVRDLADALGASRRIVDGATPRHSLHDLLRMPPLAEVGGRLQALRHNSERFLRAALS
jgi:hypothetical protein